MSLNDNNKNHQGEYNNESEEMLNKIEGYMAELTRMMDNLE